MQTSLFNSLSWGLFLHGISCCPLQGLKEWISNIIPWFLPPACGSSNLQHRLCLLLDWLSVFVLWLVHGAGCKMGTASVMVSASCKPMASKGVVVGHLSCLFRLCYLVGCAGGAARTQTICTSFTAYSLPFSSLLWESVERGVNVAP